jgi:hypothetical protein
MNFARLILSAVALSLSVPLPAAEPNLIWEATGFQSPESAIYDEVRDVIYVSNLATRGKEAIPGDGFISKLSPSGQIIDLKWVTGFDNPKGVTLANGRLYVGDDKDLVEIDLNAGQIVARYEPADGPGNFNDVTADSAGNVYVCSGRLHTVFRLQDGRFEPWVKLDRDQTGGINGLRAEADRLLLGGWTLKDANGEEQLGHLSTVDLATKSVGRIGHQPISRIDGIEPDGQGGYTVTDWVTGQVSTVTADGVPATLMTLGQGTADHEYIIAQQMLIMPSMLDGIVRAFRWAP